MEAYNTATSKSNSICDIPCRKSLPPSGKRALVYKHISQRTQFLEIYPRAVKVRKPSHHAAKSGGGIRGMIDRFSWNSKRRLTFTAENSFPSLVSQFGMTYHNSVPSGVEVKRHLNTFLTAFRRKYRGAAYLWIFEFQSRGVPHFHLFTSLPHDKEGVRQWMGETWHRIAEPSSESHLRFHTHPRNFIAWKMDNGAYLTKYMAKDYQKAVPSNFGWVGRFWGNSRGIVPVPSHLEESAFSVAFDHDDVDLSTGEVTEFRAWPFLLRTLRRHHASKWRGKKKPTFPISTYRKGYIILAQVEKYLSKYPPSSLPPF